MAAADIKVKQERLKPLGIFLGRFILLCLLLTLALLLFAPYFTELELHEYLAVVLALGVGGHLVINRWYFRQLFRRRGAFNQISDLVSLLLIICFAAVIVSGIAISQYLLPDVSFSPGLMRTVHRGSTAWLTVLLGLHAGLHLHLFFAWIDSLFPRRLSPAVKILGLVIAVYGANVFIHGEYPDRLGFADGFSFWDYDRPIIFFFIDTLAMLAAFALIGHVLGHALLRAGQRSA